MRYSYAKRLIREEQRQRGTRYGWQARKRQLTAFTLLFLSLYVICTINIWRNPRPVHHVWIDEVLVEVIEENWIDHARGGLLYLGLGCAALLGLLRVFSGVLNNVGGRGNGEDGEEAQPSSSSPFAQEGRGRYGASSAGRLRSAAADISTIAVPAWARRSAMGPAPPQPPVVVDGAAQRGSAADRVSTFDARRPMRSDADLNFFLAYEAAQRQQQQQQQQQGRWAGDGVGLRYRSGQREEAAYPADTEAAARDALSVSYETRGAQPEQRGLSTSLTAAAAASAASASSPTLPWAEFGIDHLEEALQRTREWMSEVCRKLVDDVDQCDRWFSEHQIDAYDCHHSLQEQQPAPAMPAPAPMMAARPMGMWGAPTAAAAPAAPPVPQTESKLAALLREKARCRQAQQGAVELDTALRYDQRLALESRLDVGGTFPPPAGVHQSNAELAATREYVVERLRTFAKQRLLVSYNATGGDAETWRSGYPCDAHLLLHVLRSSVKGLREYVRFGYQTGTQTQDLALCVGDTGVPYFYVRFRQGSSETLLSTRQGPTSLMEAVLAFAAVIQTYYRGVLGGVRGTVDLSEVGLLRVVTEGRRRAWGGSVGADW